MSPETPVIHIKKEGFELDMEQQASSKLGKDYGKAGLVTTVI